MAIMAVNTWVSTAGVRLHGRKRAIPDAIAATPAAITASSTMNPIAFEAVEARPDAASITLSTITTHRAAASAAWAAAAVSSIGRAGAGGAGADRGGGGAAGACSRARETGGTGGRPP